MGTRGTITFIFKNKSVKTYNHWDSYPSGLGQNLISEVNHLLKKLTIDDIIQKLDSLKIINKEIDPTLEDIKNLDKYTSLNVSSQSTMDWYCLVRKNQGSLINIMDSGYILPHDSDEEYNYVIDFNDKLFYLKEFDTKFEINNIPVDWINIIGHYE